MQGFLKKRGIILLILVITKIRGKKRKQKKTPGFEK
jgi:hypothetical protein